MKDETGERETAILDLVETIAHETGTRPIDVALAWIRQKQDQSSLSTNYHWPAYSKTACR